MNSEQAYLTKLALNGLFAVDVKEVAISIYKTNELTSVIVSGFKVSALVTRLSLIGKYINQAIDKGSWKSLPFYGENKDLSVSNQLQSIVIKLRQGLAFDKWIAEFYWLVQYGIDNALWRDSVIRSIKDGAQGASSEAVLLNKQLKQQVFEAKARIKQLESIQKELTQFKVRQEAEYDALRTIQTRSEQSGEAIRKTEVDSIKYIEGLKLTYEQLVGLSDSVQKTIESDKQRINEFEISNAEIRNQLEKALNDIVSIKEDFDSVLINAREKEKQILDQQVEIKKLRGFAADAALGGVFGNRQQALELTVRVWIVVSLISVIAAATWVFVIFSKYSGIASNGIDWLILLANVVRTSPAFLLVYFCLDRYTKERNIQEEYAFKAAVSMTITAYAEMIKDEPERVKMLVSTVQGVYTPPVLGKPFKPVSLNSKHLADSGKSVAEAVKNMKEMIGDVTKATKSSDK